MSSLLDDNAAYNTGTAKQFVSYSRLIDKWATVRLPYHGVCMGSAWIVEVSQVPEDDNGTHDGNYADGLHSDQDPEGIMYLVIESDGYTHS